ncbi:putative transposase [Candidatus Regiella insecticola LSR1]|uniref:Putative transposase n=1 Tax=Candidatus Regiella insecticola LSR1 TaxID=663321 RepID=E0WUX7_9ENTR|nr:putative transposase [Candidatus Regiella insecticola LSR1]
MALYGFFQTVKGDCSGLSIVDATPLAVCDNLRIKRHRVFQGLAERGKSSTGWFFGFKLHAIINHRGELLSIFLTSGNGDDRKPVPHLAKALFGQLYADKGYISKTLLQQLKEKGIAFITRVRRNMKPLEHTEFDNAILRKRSLVETVFDQLKNMCQIEHTRHRSPQNFIINLLGGIVAYCLTPSKPKLALYCSNIVTL